MIWRVNCHQRIGEEWEAYIWEEEMLPDRNFLVEDGICIKNNNAYSKIGEKLAYLIKMDTNPFTIALWNGYKGYLEGTAYPIEIIKEQKIKNWIFVNPVRTLCSNQNLLSSGGIFFALPSQEREQ